MYIRTRVHTHSGLAVLSSLLGGDCDDEVQDACKWAVTSTAAEAVALPEQHQLEWQRLLGEMRRLGGPATSS